MNLLPVTFLFFLGLAQAENNRALVKRVCAEGTYEELEDLPCGKINRKWFRPCLKNKFLERDQPIARLLQRCPKLVPKSRKNFNRIARHLFSYSQFHTLRVYLAGGRCKRLAPELREFFLAQPDLNVASICQSSAGSGEVPPPVVPGGTSNVRAIPGHLNSSDEGIRRAGFTPAPTARIEGSMRGWTEARVRSTPGLLASITPQQAAELGRCNNACLGITAEHFRHPAVNPQILAHLSVDCFRMIPGEAFTGLNRAQVHRMTQWPFVRRAQIKHIRPSVIRAVPFDQIGIGCQTKQNLRHHACFGITKHQLRAIRKDKSARRAFSRRCIRSSASSVGPSLSYAAVFVSVLLLPILF